MRVAVEGIEFVLIFSILILIKVRAANLFVKPLERVLVRYDKVPLDLSTIVRTEFTRDQSEMRSIVAHNAIAKYFSVRYYSQF